MKYIYPKHTSYINFKNRLFISIVSFFWRLPRVKNFKKIFLIQQHFDKQIKYRLWNSIIKNINWLTIEKITLFDIIAIEDVPKFFDRIKNKQQENNVSTYEQKRTEEYFNSLDLYHTGWGTFKVDEKIFLEKDNLDLQIIKEDSDFIMLSLNIVPSEKDKEILKIITENYRKKKYFWEILSRKWFFDFFKYWYCGWKNKDYEIGQEFENFLITYINKYQEFLWWVFYQEKKYPPLAIYIGSDWLRYTEDKWMAMMPHWYNELWIWYAHSDTKVDEYFENIKYSDIYSEKILVQHLTFLFDKSWSYDKMFSSKLSEVSLKNTGSILNSSYLYSLNFLIKLIEKEIDKVYIDVSCIWKKWNITTEKIVSFRNSLNPYFVLFQRLLKWEGKMGIEKKTELQNLFIQDTKKSIEKIKEKFDVIDSIIKFNIEYKIIETNEKLQDSMLMLTVVSILLALLSIFLDSLLWWIRQYLPSLFLFIYLKIDYVRIIIFWLMLICVFIICVLLMKKFIKFIKGVFKV